ncbi:MAG: LEA type 2 family protein [Planctomycetes bacterium]|nr:LEA type 2 family protein [Planctomycetota bacterium]
MGQLKSGFGVLAALAVAASLQACGTPQPRERIVLQPVDLMLNDAPKVIDRKLTGATLGFAFKVTNPNATSVTLERMNLNATINDKALGANNAAPAVRIGPNETVIVQIKYDVSFISGGMAIVEAVTSQNAAVAVDGTAKVSNADNRFDADPLEHPFQIK